MKETGWGVSASSGEGISEPRTGVYDNWEGNKRLGKDFFMEFLEL